MTATMAVGSYCALLGLLMIGWWVVEIRDGALHRDDRTVIEMALHLSAELLTATLLIVGGLLSILDGQLDVSLIALGMLLYTVITSPGYFLARNERGPAILFLILLIGTLSASALAISV